jgi:hypothetical protein
MTRQFVTPGFEAALRVIDAGRAAFFGSSDADLPVAYTPEVERDDRLPQFGFVGQQYNKSRLLIIAINPGNGPRDKRDRGDETSLPALERFVQDRTHASFAFALQAYREVCPGWSIWRHHGLPVIKAAGLSLDDVAYANCLPWRTRSESGFTDPAARRSAELYLMPLLSDLAPRVVVALGKKAAQILDLVPSLSAEVVVWNRARAPTAGVLAERAAAASRLSSLFREQAK